MPDTAFTYAILFASAFAAGVMNSIAGGGTLLTFPALLAALGPGGAALANATSTVALLPGSVASVWGYREDLTVNRQFAIRLLPVSLVGGLLGSLLLIWFPQEFESLVPWLILTAAVLFLVQPLVSRLIRRQQTAAPTNPDSEATPSLPAHLLAFQFLVAVYGGYFGAGIGILMLTALGFMQIGNIHRMNAVKTLLAAAINTVSVIVFIGDGLVNWPYAGVMAVAAILGGYAGARVARRLPAYVVRWVVIAIGFGLAGYFAITR